MLCMRELNVALARDVRLKLTVFLGFVYVVAIEGRARFG